mgnify:FL=1
MAKKRTDGLEHAQEPLQYLRFDGEAHGASIERGLPLDVAERRPWRFFAVRLTIRVPCAAALPPAFAAKGW